MVDGLCENCFKGVRHESTPEGNLGKIDTIAGVECYIATPTGDYPKDKVVLFLSDVFGIPLINNKLLVDDFARNGYGTIMPDLFQGDPYPVDALTRTDFDREAWRARHKPETWERFVDTVVQALQAEGVTWIATTGYCFGAPPVWRLALKGWSKVSVITHPSRFRIPEDLQEYFDQSKAPLLINSCEDDAAFPQEAQRVADAVFSGSFSPSYKRTYWEGCSHGFAVRGDMSNPKVKAGKEGAFEATVKFFNKYRDL
ncbi:dienelactone hydrolase endo-1,3,1,4-beta-D-glucanase [Dichomitus squalens LYAD-421 SS1]|uniref:dienelactone hydrolase endo-1,3,1,4-beta-D-glucanase n=1 Tax=Dichomitus squalens (strain LYAD-421) TaxID=732165 RepID=UPI0004415942|nr:dienelactone hydrolase endo-1,3,1,4-beta-D-glucanase [Dichomitus squalens LYAD-421 SS1]EJF64056.1 dienelactone hydrolase endo-1,3,1,4-beta-D-glucanase [Dichomitus squalens LYAD-421 SS1]